MIKGVNHRIVEITGMNSDYFEKAVLYVRPGKSETDSIKIDSEARSELERLVPDSGYKRKSVIFTAALIKLICASAMMFSAALIFYIIVYMM